MFVQVSHIADKVYMGIGHGDGLRTEFDMAFIKNAPVECENLNGKGNYLYF